MINPASWVNALYVCMGICVWVLVKGVICSKCIAKAVVLHNQLQLRQRDEKSFYFLLSCAFSMAGLPSMKAYNNLARK